MKKLMLGGLAALCAMLALPAFASATPAHLSSTPENFGVTGGHSELTRVAGGFTTGTTVTGTGTFENTTTGQLTLVFHHVTAQNLFTCTSEGQMAGTVATTKLTFHLISDSGSPTILITPGPTGVGQPKDHFATFNCGIFVGTIVVRGNGVIGSVTSPGCGEEAASANVTFTSNEEGVQIPLVHTGEEYTLESSVGGSEFSQSAIEGSASINLGAARKIICT